MQILVRCPNCGRTFSPDDLAVGRRCTECGETTVALSAPIDDTEAMPLIDGRRYRWKIRSLTVIGPAGALTTIVLVVLLLAVFWPAGSATEEAGTAQIAEPEARPVQPQPQKKPLALPEPKKEREAVAAPEPRPAKPAPEKEKEKPLELHRVSDVSGLFVVERPVSIGNVGPISYAARVVQVIDKKNVLVRWSDSVTGKSQRMWLEGVDASQLTDGQFYQPKGLLTIVGTKRHGATVLLARPATEAEGKWYRGQ